MQADSLQRQHSIVLRGALEWLDVGVALGDVNLALKGRDVGELGIKAAGLD